MDGCPVPPAHVHGCQQLLVVLGVPLTVIQLRVEKVVPPFGTLCWIELVWGVIGSETEEVFRQCAGEQATQELPLTVCVAILDSLCSKCPPADGQNRVSLGIDF